MSEPQFTIAVHGGAGRMQRGTLTAEQEQQAHDGLAAAVAAGRTILAAGGDSVDAVEAAVRALEECPVFNAGNGAVFTYAGDHELDAAIMEGATRAAGAVAGIRYGRRPIAAARAVMAHSEHVMLAGAGADAFIADQGLEQVSNDWFDTPHRRAQWQRAQANPDSVGLEAESIDHPTDHPADHRYGTVGAVACDAAGHVAAATSTGGITNKRYGRIGDSPLIGSGTFADDRSVAVSATGHGEYFIRYAAAHEIAARVRHAGQTLNDAVRAVLHDDLAAAGGEGGAIAVSPQGEMVLDANVSGMYRGWSRTDSEIETALYI